MKNILFGQNNQQVIMLLHRSGYIGWITNMCNDFKGKISCCDSYIGWTSR